ncbi:dodecin family protein [Arenimonas fontis]|uniref:Dodecin domain-containing protein n=1 Tax=Arenimonas fontis TaxID=2608255 RepID=A0A5B2ZD92_9GAMM|nr:dodecin family protein [Arenimonas fontis]KAA2285174.1 dodecin domain-containing protein [Arenimonas fontis]
MANSTVTKVIEVSASSKKSIEDAAQSGLKKVAKTVKGIKGAWVNEIKIVTDDDGSIAEWRVNMRVSFVVS